MADEKNENQNDGLVVVEALRDYASPRLTFLKGQKKKANVEIVKKCLKAHPLDSPIKVVSGLSRPEADEIKAYCDDYAKRAEEASHRRQAPRAAR